MKDALQVNSFDELLLRDAGISWNRVIAVSFVMLQVLSFLAGDSSSSSSSSSSEEEEGKGGASKPRTTRILHVSVARDLPSLNVLLECVLVPTSSSW